MNLALSALLIILFLLPAFFFRIGISFPVRHGQEDDQLTHDIISRNVSKALSRLNFTETVFLFSIIPIILHFISLSLINLTGHSVDYELLLNIFSGKQNVLAGSANAVFHVKLLYFLGYTLIESLIACGLGWVIIRWLGGRSWLIKMLMGKNIWFRLFTGTTLGTKREGEQVSILVEALVETKEATVIYSGLLKSYELTANSDELASITLTTCFRRDMRKEPQSMEYGELIPIRGDVFTINGKNIININVFYMTQVTDTAMQEKAPTYIDKNL